MGEHRCNFGWAEGRAGTGWESPGGRNYAEAGVFCFDLDTGPNDCSYIFAGRLAVFSSETGATDTVIAGTTGGHDTVVVCAHGDVFDPGCEHLSVPALP